MDEIERTFGEVPVYYSTSVNPGRMYLMQGLTAQYDHQRAMVRWVIDPWGPNRFEDPVIEEERRKGLDHLARELDAIYRSYGWDPNEWRETKERERREWERWMMQERVYSLYAQYGQILQPSAFVSLVL